jgi:hypothetical protein
VDRVQAHLWLSSAGFGPLLELIGRSTQDSPLGLGPALDRAFAIYGDPIVAAEDVEDFTRLLSGAVYDLAVPVVCLYVDSQVDAPLTKVAGSQLCKQVLRLRDDAYAMSGYSIVSEYAGGYRTNLDFLEPSEQGDDL